MKPGHSLFARILVWFFLSLIVLVAVLLGVLQLQFRMDPHSPLLGKAGNRITVVARLISHDLGGAPRTSWTAVLDRYSEAYGVDLVMCAGDGRILAGKDLRIPAEVTRRIAEHRPPGPPPEASEPPPPGSPDPTFRVRTSNPTRYWVGVGIPLMAHPHRPPLPGTLLAVSGSFTGNGLFFDPVPWAIVAAVVLVLSIALWLPLVRSITRPISRITKATGEIAAGRFEVRLPEARTDEIGRLCRSINEMSSRLAGYVTGQKRFLGDVSHELASPIARIELGLGILEKRVDEKNKDRVRDVIEEVRSMSDLVNELLSFSRAEVDPAKVSLERIRLAPVVGRVVDREGPQAPEIRVDLDEAIEVLADPELLARALANLVRNAARYAGGAAGPIEIRAGRKGGAVEIEVRDSGPGAPEESLGRIFEPFYRLDSSRGRETGGVGLGLAIVKTCVEACGGTVSARNLEKGFAVTMVLDAGSSAD